MDLIKFKKWLVQNGAEILPNSSEWEHLRFKGSEVAVFYKSGKTSGDYATNAYKCFRASKKWDGRPINVGRKNNYKKQKADIIKRDGTACFYCGNLLKDDITLEHLLSLTSGGKNTLGNMVLAHEKCNNHVHNLTVVDKVSYALKLRVEKLTNLKDE